MQHFEDLSHKKRAIYIALLNYLNPKQAGQATDIWIKEYSNKSAFELQSYITRITRELSVKINRKDIQQSIIKMLLNDSPDSNDKKDEHEYLAKETPATEAQLPHIVFSSFMMQWLSEVEKINADLSLSIKRYISNNLIKLELNFDDMIKIKTWLNTKGNNLYIKDLTIEQMEKIFHFCYVGSCEYIGPVKTDKIVSEVAKIVGQMPDAINFSPKKFF